MSLAAAIIYKLLSKKMDASVVFGTVSSYLHITAQDMTVFM